MNKTHFIREIEIKNYKLFKDFKAKGFGRVNLIGGKNNVGKTAFMEACYLNVHAKNIYNFTDALGNVTLRRDKLNFLLDNFKGRSEEPLFERTKKYIENIANLQIKSNIDDVGYRIIEDNIGIKRYNFKFQNIDKEVNIREFSYERKRIKNIKFMDRIGLSKKNIIDTYKSIEYNNLSNYIEKELNTFDNEIVGFEFKNEKLYINTNNMTLDLIEFGDGTRILFSIIILLFSCRDGYLFIDEIENGIHYTNFDKFWGIILKISKEQNVQVFATTHSKECIESFNRVQKELNDEDTFYFEMYKNIKNDNISMRQLDAKQLEYELKLGEGFRGE